MSLTQCYAAPSLDGFIADADNSLDWILTRKTDDDGSLSFRECMAGVGAMAMGTTTYEVEFTSAGIARNGDFVAAKFSVAP